MASCQWTSSTVLLCVLFCLVMLQLVQEFRVLLLTGRKLVFPVQTAAVVRADITIEIQVEGSSSGSTAKCIVSLMFTGNCRTVVRLLAGGSGEALTHGLHSGSH